MNKTDTYYVCLRVYLDRTFVLFAPGYAISNFLGSYDFGGDQAKLRHLTNGGVPLLHHVGQRLLHIGGIEALDSNLLVDRADTHGLLGRLDRHDHVLVLFGSTE